ncbi:MAG: tripartite tricarboxylate transporter TctB family protein [Kiloniellaceae bacterium]
MKPVDKRDLAAGAALIGVGLVFAIGALQLRIGTARSMGAGFFPLIFSIAAIVLGVLVVIPALSRAGELVVPPWRPFLAICGSIAVFALVMVQAGMLPAVALSVCVAALADRRSSLPGTLLLAAGLAAGCWAVFVIGLGLPIPTFRFPF